MSRTPVQFLQQPEQLSALLERLSDGVVVLDTQHRIVWVNEAFTAMSGFSLEAVKGHHPTVFMPDSETVGPGANLLAPMEDALAQCGCFAGRQTHVRADGSTWPAEVSVDRAQDGCLFIIKKVSAEDAHQEELARLASMERDTVILALASLAEQRSLHAPGELQRLEVCVMAMARWVLEHHPERLPPGWDPQTVGRCAMLHDIGLVGVSDHALAGEADQQRREHPRLGAAVIERVLSIRPDSGFLHLAHGIIANHHEAYDGSGYPRGLTGEAIPLAAQLVAVAHTLEGLTARRPEVGFGEALVSIGRQRGALFGPLAVDALLGSAGAVAAAWSGLAAAQQPRPSQSGPSLVEQALAEALATPGGEVVVRAGEVVGRIYVWRQRIAWAHITALSGVLTHRLSQTHGLERPMLDELIAECRRTGTNFGETLLARGVINRQDLREVLREHVAERLRAILQLAHAVALFVPQARPYGSDLTFSLDELR